MKTKPSSAKRSIERGVDRDHLVEASEDDPSHAAPPEEGGCGHPKRAPAVGVSCSSSWRPQSASCMGTRRRGSGGLFEGSHSGFQVVVLREGHLVRLAQIDVNLDAMGAIVNDPDI